MKCRKNRGKQALLAAGLLVGAAAMSGCAANTAQTAAPTPQTAQQETAQPPTAQPAAAQQSEQPEAAQSAQPDSTDEAPGPIPLRVDGQETDVGAMEEGDMLLLPLLETAQALGYTVKDEQQEDETLVQRTVSMEKDESRITVAWVVSDNTIRQITWQKDGLLIPVDAQITTQNDVVYVPSAFFETAAEVTVSKKQDAVEVKLPAPKETPEKQEQKP